LDSKSGSSAHLSSTYEDSGTLSITEKDVDVSDDGVSEDSNGDYYSDHRDFISLNISISAVGIDDNTLLLLREAIASSDRVNLQITVRLVEGLSTTWQGAIDRTTTYISVPRTGLADGSKQSIVSLLELAELLGCSRCIFGISKQFPSQLMKTFLFLGFLPTPPQCKFPVTDSDISALEELVFMVYEV